MKRCTTTVLAAALLFGCVGSNEVVDPDQLADVPRRGAVLLDPIPQIENGVGTLALTFEDGPAASFSRGIIDTLTAYRIPATFFWLGSRIEGNREVVQYAHDQGHQVANHSFYHHRQVLLDRDEFVFRLRATKQNIGDADGARLYYRFPYGEADDEHLAWLAATPFSKGGRYQSVGWNIDSADFDFGRGYPEIIASTRITREAGKCGIDENPFVDDYVGWVQFATRRTGGGVILFHDTQRITRDFLGEIITYLRDARVYWKELERQDAERKKRYQRYYSCMGVDGGLSFKFESLSSGSWPSLAQGSALDCDTPYDAAAYPTATTSFASDIKPILDSTAAGCATASCHPSGRGASGYSATTVAELLSPGSQARFAGKCGVVRGDPDASFLIDKLLGRSGRRMPLELSPLSDAQLELFKRWISEGAPP
ncbi:MAG: polysaccharide deacetylase family protein [Myxococcales bacterium]|nr:polysaccharide deacetylase family protein [Myxococcales bacterium]